MSDDNVTFTAAELRKISAALSIAASVYDQDAANAAAHYAALREASNLPPAPCRLAEQFDRQAAEARALADKIDDPESRLGEAGAVELVEHVELESDDGAGDRCTNPGGHVWNRTAGEADEARLAGDVEHDNIRCVYCGADGDA